MTEQPTEKAVMEAEIKFKDMKVIDTREQVGSDEIGTMVVDRHTVPEHQMVNDVLVGHEIDAKIVNKVVKIAIHYNTPTPIEDDLYYPVVEWRLTQERLDDADVWPQWKLAAVMLNGEVPYITGRALQGTFFVAIAVQGMTEEQDGMFFSDPPFSFPQIKISSVGLAVIKGSDIDDVIDVMRGYRVGASRRRG